ncbi:MAG: LytTR family DNA-binding domain-containing protein [Sediminibacterium sp.]
MRTITCMIVEDEPHAMQLLEDYIGKIPFMQLETKCYDAMAAVSFLRDHKVDVIFLDINMPLVTGIELAAMIPKEQKIIFTTAYSEYALDSFEYHVVDYLLKPITFKRFMQAINKLQSFMQAESNGGEFVETAVTQDYLFVKSGKQVHKIEYTDIYYFEALKEYIAIHTEKEKILVYKRMKEVAESLPPKFVRIHNSYIVNIQHIKNIGSNLVLIQGQRLPVSNSYRELFQQRISARML